MGIFSRKNEIIESQRLKIKHLADDAYTIRKAYHETQELNEQLSSELIAATEELDDLKKQYADLKEQYDNRLASNKEAMDAASYWCDKYTALRMEVYGGLPEEECESCQLHLEPETEEDDEKA